MMHSTRSTNPAKARACVRNAINDNISKATRTSFVVRQFGGIFEPFGDVFFPHHHNGVILGHSAGGRGLFPFIFLFPVELAFYSFSFACLVLSYEHICANAEILQMADLLHLLKHAKETFAWLYPQRCNHSKYGDSCHGNVEGRTACNTRRPSTRHNGWHHHRMMGGLFCPVWLLMPSF